jgi:hypothetical protein
MGCSLCPSTPAAPDYTAAANAQGQANLQAAQQQSLLNNPNVVNPYGSETYTGPTDGSGRPTVTQTLSPSEQAKYDAMTHAQLSSLGILNADKQNISDALLTPFGMAGSAKGTITGPLGQTATNLDQQKNLGFDNLGALPTADSQYAQKVQDAVYGQGAQYLDPQFAQQKSDLTAQLANQGIMPGSAAYDREILNYNNTKQKAYGDLNQSAIQTGVGAMNTLYNEAMAGRQQGANELTTQGQFGNAANLAQFNANNSGVAQQANIGQMLTSLANAARGQNYQEYTQNKTMPLNMINSLMSGSQINNPTFQPYNATNITATPVLQGANLQGQANAAGSSADAGLAGGGLGALGNILSKNTACQSASL